MQSPISKLFRNFLQFVGQIVLLAAPLVVGLWLFYFFWPQPVWLALGVVLCAVGAFWARPLLYSLPGFQRFGVHVQTGYWATKQYARVHGEGVVDESGQPVSTHEGVFRSLVVARYYFEPSHKSRARLIDAINESMSLYEFTPRVLGEEAALFENDLPQYRVLAAEVASALKESSLPHDVLWGSEPDYDAAGIATVLYLELKLSR